MRVRARAAVRLPLVCQFLWLGGLAGGQAWADGGETAKDTLPDPGEEIRRAREVLEDPLLNQDETRHIKACGQLAVAEWTVRTRLFQQWIALHSDARFDGHDVAMLAARNSRLRAELMQQTEELVRTSPRQYMGWLERLYRSRWRNMPFGDLALAARWYMLRESNAGQADYLALRFITGIDPETRSTYYHEHCP